MVDAVVKELILLLECTTGKKEVIRRSVGFSKGITRDKH
jgi:hypothetical protein